PAALLPVHRSRTGTGGGVARAVVVVDDAPPGKPGRAAAPHLLGGAAPLGAVSRRGGGVSRAPQSPCAGSGAGAGRPGAGVSHGAAPDRKSTRLNSSHVKISYAVFCLKKKKKTRKIIT